MISWVKQLNLRDILLRICRLSISINDIYITENYVFRKPSHWNRSLIDLFCTKWWSFTDTLLASSECAVTSRQTEVQRFEWKWCIGNARFRIIETTIEKVSSFWTKWSIKITMCKYWMTSMATTNYSGAHSKCRLSMRKTLNTVHSYLDGGQNYNRPNS